MRREIPAGPRATTGTRLPGESGVKGIFHDAESVQRAVRGLVARSVPADSIRVFVVPEGGRGRREVRVEEESGALRGGLVGAGLGALAGLAIVILALAGVFGEPAVGFFGGLMGGLGAVALMAAAGVPLGILLGMGRWRSKRRISDEDLRTGKAVVVVESEQLEPLAREILERSGAERVEVENG